MMARYPEKTVRITGIGQSPVARPSDRTALDFTADACLQAIADAGLEPGEVDGIATYFGKLSVGGGIGPVSTTEVQQALGLDIAWSDTASEGHSHLGCLFNAILALDAGLARHVLVFRAVAQATARAQSRSSTLLGGGHGGRAVGNSQWTVPFGAMSPANMWALYAQAYFERFGGSPEQLGWIAVNARAMAAGNPNAIYRDPITIEDYLASRVISSPLRIFDCDTHIDGATALIVSRADAIGSGAKPPIHIEAIGAGVSGLSLGIHAGDFTCLPGAEQAGRQMWARTDLTPADVDNAQIYDGFSILTVMWLEAMGLVPRGGALELVDGGKRIAREGDLPLNTGGGQLSGGRWHGYGHLHEACTQLWGRGGERQVADAEVSIVTNGGYGYGAMLLRTD